MSIMAAPKRNLTAVRALPVPFAMTARLYSVVAVPAVCPHDGSCLTRNWLEIVSLLKSNY
jgi:hypothetical protein